MIDYARPCMMAEKALKDLHNAALEKDYEKAREMALEAVAQARATYAALTHMLETERARPHGA